MPEELDETTVGLFPGQGSIGAQAGSPWRSCPQWSIIAEISEATGVDVSKLLIETSATDIVRTDRAQLATFALSMVGWNWRRDRFAQPRYLAGHSLGEFSALCAGGVLNVTDAARLVATRGSAMALASDRAPGTMVALMGADDGALQSLESSPDLWVANVNGTGQIVASGTVQAVTDLVDNARARGWRRATVLPVGGAFHSPLMSPAQESLDEALATVQFHESEHEIAANVDGAWRGGGDAWRDLLSRQLTSPVQFLDMMVTMPQSVTHGVELPPSGVLVGLTKRIRDFDNLSALDEPVSDS